MTRPFLTILCAALALVLFSCGGGSSAPPASPEPSRESEDPASPAAPASVLAGVYTEAQAERGAGVFRASCSECHGSGEFRGDKFFLNYEGVTVGRFVDQLARTMPDGAPGTLPGAHYVDVTAYILRLNGFPTGSTELPDRMEFLNAIRIERPSEER